MDDPVYNLITRLPLEDDDGAALTETSSITYTLRKMPAFTVVGYSRRTCNADGRSVEDIPAVWSDFLKNNSMAQIKNRTVPAVMYAVYSDYEKDWTKEYNFLIGCGVTRAPVVPKGMTARLVPAQTYAHFVVRGEMPRKLMELWGSIWLSTLPRTYTFDYEVYDQRFTRPDNREIDVFVAVDPEKIGSPQA